VLWPALVGVRVDGRKELVALAEGYRESAGSWADLLRDCKRRGMRAPVLAVGDGALGFWNALRRTERLQGVQQTREAQRTWTVSEQLTGISFPSPEPLTAYCHRRPA
jgi:hypothetical protein